MKKLLTKSVSFILAILLTILLVPYDAIFMGVGATVATNPADAEPIVWDGTVATSFESGTGSQTDPYIIATPQQLAFLAQQVNSGTNYIEKYFEITNNFLLNNGIFSRIYNGQQYFLGVTYNANDSLENADWLSGRYLLGTGVRESSSLNKYEAGQWYKYNNETATYETVETIPSLNSWTPIGNKTYQFKGYINGGGHYIKGLYINNESDYQGLFGYGYNYGYGNFENITIANSYVKGNNFVGSLSGYLSGNISNCANDSVVIAKSSCAGGITGYITGDAKDSANRGMVVSLTSGGSGYQTGTGGIAGNGSGDNVQNCYNEGSVYAKDYVGGIVGWAFCDISNCYNTGNVAGIGLGGYSDVTGGGTQVGGITGYANGSIKKCYNTANIAGGGNVGGIAGATANGGANLETSNCYNTGSIKGENLIGGICGGSQNYNIINCHNQGSVQGDWDYSNIYVGAIIANPTENLQNCYYSASAAAGYYSKDVYYQSNGQGAKEVGSVTPDEEGKVEKISATALEESYKGFNFNNIWEMYDKPYPTLIDFGSKNYRYAITYKNGDNIVGELVYNKGAEAVIAEQPVDSNGCEFLCWLGDDGKKYYPSNKITVETDITFTAVWAYQNTEAGVWQGDIDTNFDGNGTEEDPYLITSAAELAGLASNVNSIRNYSSGKFFKQTKDILLNNSNNDYSTGIYAKNEWTPIGNSSYWFQGTYDGANHTVSGIYINNSTKSYQGLFGYASGTIKNVIVKNSYIKAGNYVGAIAGAKRANGIYGSANSSPVIGNNYVGGIVGIEESYAIVVENCLNEGPISGVDYIGGVVGKTAYTTSAVKNSRNSGVVVANGRVGGIIGSAGGEIVKCSNIGTINATGSYVGGIVGSGNAVIDQCSNFGNITSGNTYTGGIAGYNSKNTTNCYNISNITGTKYVGGIVGNYSGNELSSCYNIGNITGDTCGSILGYGTASKVRNCYYLEGTATNKSGVAQYGIGASTTSGTTADTVGSTTSVTGEQLKMQSTFTGFDFENVWIMSMAGDEGMPVFRESIYEVKIIFLSYTGQELFAPVSYGVSGGNLYKIDVPTFQGLHPDMMVVSGVMPEKDVTITVTYYDRNVTAFGNCNDNIRWELSDDGILKIIGSGDMPDYDLGTAPWYGNVGDIKQVYIDSLITSVGSYAFYGLNSLTYVNLGNSLKTVGEYAFADCAQLKAPQLLQSITSIKDGAFSGCNAFKDVAIPAAVLTVGEKAFYGNEGLKKIVFEGNVTQIGDNAFDNCTNLTEIYFRREPAKNVGANAFGTVSGKLVYYYGTVSAWNSVVVDGVWNGYWAIPANAVSEEITEGNLYIIKVVDRNNTPLNNAVVTLNGITVTTKANGMAYFVKPNSAVPLTVSCADHINFNDTAYMPEENHTIDYIVLTDSPTTVQGVSINGKSIASSVYTLNINLEKKATISVSGYSKYTILRYQLLQGNRVVASINTQSQSAVFNVNTADLEEERLVVSMLTSDGSTVSTALNIDVIKPADFSKENFISGLDKIVINLPIVGDVPLNLAMKAKDIEVAYSERKIKIGINVDLTEVDKNGIDKMLESIEKKKKAAYKKATPGIVCELTGYIEVEYTENGEYVIGRSNVKLFIGGKLEFDAHASLWGVVGVHFKAGFSGGGGVSIDFVSYTVEDGFVFEDVSYIMKNALEIEGGAYVLWGAGSADLYGALESELTIEIYPDFGIEAFKLSGEVGAKWSIFWGLFSGKRAFWWGDIYSYTRSQAYQLKLLYSVKAAEAVNDLSNYSFVNREYLENRSEWLPTHSTYSLRGQENSYTLLQQGAYENIAPKIVTVDDTTVMVWLDDNENRNDDNFQTLMYSVLDTDTGLWQMPIQVDSNNTFDCEFDLLSNGDTIYLVYTEQSEELSGIGDLDISSSQDIEYLTGNVEVMFTIFNGTGFNTPVRITNNRVAEILPELSMVDGNLVLNFAEMGSYTSALETNGNSVMQCTYKNGAWSKPQTIIENQNHIGYVASGLLGNEVFTAYAVDTDGDSQTNTDIALVVIDENGVATVIDSGVITKVLFVKLGNSNQLIWQTDGKIYMLNTLNGSKVSLLPENVSSYKDFDLIKTKNGSALLTFIATNKDSSGTDVYGIFINENGATGSVIALTDTQNYVDSYSIAVKSDDLVICFTETIFELDGEEVITTTDFKAGNIVMGANITLDGIDYSAFEVSVGNNTEVNLSVTNNGMLPENLFEINLYAPNGDLVYTTQYEQLLLQGETKEFDISFILQQVAEGNYRFEIIPKTYNDVSSSDNNYSVELANADLSIIADQKVVGEKTYILCLIENIGNITANGVLKVSKANGELLFEKDCKDIEVGQKLQFVVEIDTALNGNIIVCSVESGLNDRYQTNNTAQVIVVNILGANNSVQSTVINPTISANSFVYDKYIGQDITWNITSGAEYFVGIEGLVQDEDYIFQQGEVTINAGYLNTLTEKQHGFNLCFDLGGDEHVLRTVSVTVTDTTPITISGSVKIEGDAVVCGTVWADISQIVPNDASISYEWKIGDTVVSTDTEYSIKPEDCGLNLTLTVTARGGYTGSFESSVTVDRSVGSACSAPIVQSVETNRIVLAYVKDVEYSIDGINWQNSNVFDNLLPETDYIFYQRFKETDTAYAGAISTGTAASTSKAYVPGNINDDSLGNINLEDVVALAQIVAGWQGVAHNPKALDVNGDGFKTLDDVVHLAQYVAGWSGIVLH